MVPPLAAPAVRWWGVAPPRTTTNTNKHTNISRRIHSYYSPVSQLEHVSNATLF